MCPYILCAAVVCCDIVANEEADQYNVVAAYKWIDVATESDFDRLHIDGSSAVRLIPKDRPVLAILLRRILDERVSVLRISGHFVREFSWTDLSPLAAKRSHLKYLEVRGLDSDQGISNLLSQRFPVLRHVSFDGCSDETLKWISQLPALQYASVTGRDISDNGVSSLGLSTTLSGLRIRTKRVTGIGFRAWSEPFPLLHLDISTERFSAEGIHELSRFRALRSLHLTASIAQARIILAATRGLRVLRFHNNGRDETDESTDALVRLLSHLSELKFLDLSGHHITESAIEMVSEMRGLRALILNGSRVNSEAFDAISSMAQLRLLHVAGSEINATALRRIAMLSELRSLDLSFCNVDDESVGCIVELKNLRNLYIAETNVTVKAVPALARMKQLRVLRVGSRVFGSAARAMLKKRLPDCDIDPSVP